VQPEDYKDCKDANEILQKYGADQIRKCIENAVQPPIRDAIELSSVEYINPYEIPKVATGINAVDELLCGGLPLGQMILLTGKAGDGKSTFASQLLVNAIDQGYKVFSYSGELPNYVFKSWIDLQAAGENNINTNQGKWGLYNVVKPDILDQINKWYKGRAWLYDNKIQSFEDDEPEGLIKLLENVIQQYGVNVILLDNLMTGLDLEKNLGEDKYERQSLFTKMLIRIALQYNVLILLVAHKRKTYGNNEVNESVSGSQDIINLASIVMSYEAVTQRMIDNDNATKQDRVLKITKNRLFGNTNNYGYIMHYSQISKRVYMTERELNKQYSWKMYEEAEVEEFSFK
jgi:predicted ATP-dependent serine protease